jgi:Fe-S cluster assembly protein SufB
MEEPRWAMLNYPEIDYQDQFYYATPKSMAKKPKSLDEVDPKLLATYAKLGIPLKEQMLLAGVEGDAEPRKVAVDAVFDSVSVGTTFKAELAKAGVIFCSISEAVREHPELVKQYLGSVVPPTDNFFATLNSAVFSDGSFVYIPKGTRCPMELSTYFRINAENTGQFERTLIICDEGAYVSYLEGCTAPEARHQPAARGGGGNRDPEGCRGEILHRAELVSGRRERGRRDLQLRHQARRLPGRPGQGDVDASGNRVGDHLEIPVLHPARR